MALRWLKLEQRNDFPGCWYASRSGRMRLLADLATEKQKVKCRDFIPRLTDARDRRRGCYAKLQ
eukprot:1701830-Pleurochrysis_carterae.AAC.2